MILLFFSSYNHWHKLFCVALLEARTDPRIRPNEWEKIFTADRQKWNMFSHGPGSAGKRDMSFPTAETGYKKKEDE